MSRLSEIAQEEYKMEMTPMIDVVFLLLIFFLCTIKFKTLEGKLAAYLPKDVGVNQGQADPVEKVEVKVRVLRQGEKRDPNDQRKPWSGEGRFEYVGREVAYSIGPRRVEDLEALESHLERLHRADPERKATIAPLSGTVYGDVVPVLDMAIQAGFTDITFVGEPLEEA